MTLCRERHFGPDKGDFSLYFLAHLPEGMTPPAVVDSEEVRDDGMMGEIPLRPAHGAVFALPQLQAADWIKTFDFPVLELTHNHGTEKDESFSYHNGSLERQSQRVGKGPFKAQI